VVPRAAMRHPLQEGEAVAEAVVVPPVWR
jgi:hypothetical protein